jgi:hypothetical protein
MGNWLSNLLRRRPQLATDYRTYNMQTMRHWGSNAFWWPKPEGVGKSACIFGQRPRIGDALIGQDGESVFVIVGVRTESNPGDQHFVQVVFWGYTQDLPEREVGTDALSRAREDYIE